MKVTQENKGLAVSAEVGVESGTQEFPARLPRPSSPLPCTMGLYPPRDWLWCLLVLGSPLIAKWLLATQSAAASMMGGGLSCLLHSCPRALWEQLEDKGMGETPPNSSYLLG